MMGSHGVAALFFSTAAGYWVLTLAAKEKEGTKKIGHLVGLIIIVVSLLGAACGIYRQVSACSGKYGMMGGKACPFTGRPMMGSSAPLTSK